MSLEINNGYSQQSRFYETQNCNLHAGTGNTPAPPTNDSMASLFEQISKMFSSQSSAYGNLIKQLFGGSAQPRTEDYGGFSFKNGAEKSQVYKALIELRAEQAANPGRAVSKKFKIGKYKYQVSVDQNGQVDIKRKKKKGGFFSKLGGAIKSFVKKALPIVSTLAMFVPGLQPFALAARIATGAMGFIDGIKKGNIFGAVMSGVSALSGVGGKVGTFFSGLTSKAGGLMNSFGSNIMGKMGTAGQWFSNAFSSGSSLLGAGKQWLSNWTSGIGSNVTGFLGQQGTGILNNLTNSMGGRFGQWLQQKGPDLVSRLADTMGNRVSDWLYGKISNEAERMLQQPLGPGFRDLVNSGFAQFLNSLLQGRRI